MNGNLFLSIIEKDPQKIRALLQKILSQRQFAGLRESGSNKLLKWLAGVLKNSKLIKFISGIIRAIVNSLANLFAGSGWFLHLVLGLLLAVTIFFIVKSIKKKISGSVKKIEDSEEESESIDPEVRRKQAESAAEDGDLTDAIRHLYVSLLLFLNIKGIVEYRPSRTNRETEVLIDKVESGTLKTNFKLINRIFEDKVYALKPCNQLEFGEFREAYNNCKEGIGEI